MDYRLSRYVVEAGFENIPSDEQAMATKDTLLECAMCIRQLDEQKAFDAYVVHDLECGAVVYILAYDACDAHDMWECSSCHILTQSPHDWLCDDDSMTCTDCQPEVDAMVKIKLLDGCNSDFTPTRATPGSSGFDARAAEGCVINPGDVEKILLGFAMEMPPGWECQIRSRSGFSTNHKVIMVNGIGTVDSDYRGPVMASMMNLGNRPVTIVKGDKIAQLVFQRVPTVGLSVVDELTETTRGDGGFGSTGK
jgi:dUTP pyrophosphatase